METAPSLELLWLFRESKKMAFPFPCVAEASRPVLIEIFPTGELRQGQQSYK